MLNTLRGGLIVSCQADQGDALYGPKYMAAMAMAAESGGAVGIRANGPDDIAAIRAAVRVPVIGLWKRPYPESAVYITPTMLEVDAVAAAGAHAVAVDFTQRRRPNDAVLGRMVALIRQRHPDLLLMADIATAAEGMMAADLGVDVVATTLSGYTADTAPSEAPDIELVGMLAGKLSIPVIAEGRYQTPEQCREALKAGAWAVVVGTAITRPTALTQRFVRVLGID
jgi:N-acylglucosamine-6-phosphate 2-epimerase